MRLSARVFEVHGVVLVDEKSLTPAEERQRSGSPDDPVVESLRKRGHRITAQRETILQIFREQPHGHHLSAEELHTKLLERGSNVSLATAYRTLKLLSSLGLLRELDFAEGHKHYELKQDSVPHQHIICIGCNVTIEFEDHFLEEAGQKIGARHNFEVIDAQFKIFGLCPMCKESKKGPGQIPSRMQSERMKARLGRMRTGAADEKGEEES